MPQGAATVPGCFQRLMQRVTDGLEHVLMYLDDAIAFDVTPLEHVRTLREFFSRLREHDLKLSPSKARLGATELDFLGHSISPAGLHPDTNKVRAMTEMPMPTNISQLRSLLGGLSYYRKFSSNAQRTLPRPAAPKSHSRCPSRPPTRKPTLPTTVPPSQTLYEEKNEHFGP